MARTTVVLSGTQDRSWDMVTPAQIEMTSLPSTAALMPCSARIWCAICGLELHDQLAPLPEPDEYLVGLMVAL